MLIILLLSVGTISSGQVGIKTRLGAVVGTVRPGIYFVTPFIESVTPMDVQTQKEQVDASAASSDLQTVTATVAVNFHVKPDDAKTIFANIGKDYQSRIIDPAIQESVKSVTANYTAEELITKREDVREKILALLTTKLQTYGVNMDSLNIVNFDFSKTFNDAIEAKVTAVQNALAAQNDLQASQFKAQAIKVTAEAANNDNYIHLQELDVEKAAIAKWDGRLPAQMVPGGAVPFLNLQSK